MPNIRLSLASDSQQGWPVFPDGRSTPRAAAIGCLSRSAFQTAKIGRTPVPCTWPLLAIRSVGFVYSRALESSSSATSLVCAAFFSFSACIFFNSRRRLYCSALAGSGSTYLAARSEPIYRALLQRHAYSWVRQNVLADLRWRADRSSFGLKSSTLQFVKGEQRDLDAIAGK